MSHNICKLNSFWKGKVKVSHSYLISNTELFEADRTLATVGWDSLQPKLWKFLNKSLDCFPLQEKYIRHQITCIRVSGWLVALATWYDSIRRPSTF